MAQWLDEVEPSGSARDLKAAVAASAGEFGRLRRDLHRHPELAFDEGRTSGIVADCLASYGYEVHRGLGGTGVVATLSICTGRGPVIGLRADMDALPIHEETGLDHASARPGVMHACGHDGHTAILLCAARHIAESVRRDGTVRLFFQPAEETGAGARRMVEEGLFERFPVDAVFALHNLPGMRFGLFGFAVGPIMASSDTGIVRFSGKGGHGAYPDRAIDPVLASAAFVVAAQSVVSRNVSPSQTAVLSIGSIHGGTAGSIIPEQVEMRFTLRALDEEVRRLLRRRICEIAEAQAASYGATAEVAFTHSVGVTANDRALTELARGVALDAFGPDEVTTLEPFTGGEDFSFMLGRCPGSFVHVGAGDGAPLHNPSYDFNDGVIAPAAEFWVRLVEKFLDAPATSKCDQKCCKV